MKDWRASGFLPFVAVCKSKTRRSFVTSVDDSRVLTVNYCYGDESVKSRKEAQLPTPCCRK